MERHKLRKIQWIINTKARMNPDGKATNESNEGLFHRWFNGENGICAIIEDSSGLVHFVYKDNFTDFKFVDSIEADSHPKMVM
jgi:hypothetical protein